VNAGTGASLSLPLELKELTKSGTINVQRLEISLDQIPDGKYLLYVHVKKKVDGQVASVRVPLTIGR
jgi:hypothetical protein